VPVGADEPIISDASYWIAFSSGFTYSGPFRVLIPEGGYVFGLRGYVDNIVVEVPVSDKTQTITIKGCGVADQPEGDVIDAGGDDAAWLEYLEITPKSGGLDERKWNPFSCEPVSVPFVPLSVISPKRSIGSGKRIAV